MRYSGYLYDGEAFKDLDNNLQGESLSFKLTYSMVIDAWEIALPYAHPGETFEIITSPKYAYGGKGWYGRFYMIRRLTFNATSF